MQFSIQREVLTTDFWWKRAIKLIPWEAATCYGFIEHIVGFENNSVLVVAFFLLLICSAASLLKFTSATGGQVAIMSFAFLLAALCLSKFRISQTFLGVNGSVSEFFATNIPYAALALFIATTALLFPKSIESLSSALKSLQRQNAP